MRLETDGVPVVTALQGQLRRKTSAAKSDTRPVDVSIGERDLSCITKIQLFFLFHLKKN